MSARIQYAAAAPHVPACGPCGTLPWYRPRCCEADQQGLGSCAQHASSARNLWDPCSPDQAYSITACMLTGGPKPVVHSSSPFVQIRTAGCRTQLPGQWPAKGPVKPGGPSLQEQLLSKPPDLPAAAVLPEPLYLLDQRASPPPVHSRHPTHTGTRGVYCSLSTWNLEPCMSQEDQSQQRHPDLPAARPVQGARL